MFSNDEEKLQLWGSVHQLWTAYLGKFGIDPKALPVRLRIDSIHSYPETYAINTWWPAEVAAFEANRQLLLRIHGEDLEENQERTALRAMKDAFENSPQRKFADTFLDADGDPELMAAILVCGALFALLDGRRAAGAWSQHEQPQAYRNFRRILLAARHFCWTRGCRPLDHDITRFASTVIPGEFEDLLLTQVGDRMIDAIEALMFRMAALLGAWRPVVIEVHPNSARQVAA